MWIKTLPKVLSQIALQIECFYTTLGNLFQTCEGNINLETRFKFILFDILLIDNVCYYGNLYAE